MFKILTLKPGVDADLQSIQDQYEIDAVDKLGADSVFNQYLLVQYNTKPGTPLQAKEKVATLPAAPVPAKKDDAKPAKGK